MSQFDAFYQILTVQMPPSNGVLIASNFTSIFLPFKPLFFKDDVSFGGIYFGY